MNSNIEMHMRDKILLGTYTWVLPEFRLVIPTFMRHRVLEGYEYAQIRRETLVYKRDVLVRGKVKPNPLLPYDIVIKVMKRASTTFELDGDDFLSAGIWNVFCLDSGYGLYLTNKYYNSLKIDMPFRIRHHITRIFYGFFIDNIERLDRECDFLQIVNDLRKRALLFPTADVKSGVPYSVDGQAICYHNRSYYETEDVRGLRDNSLRFRGHFLFLNVRLYYVVSKDPDYGVPNIIFLLLSTEGITIKDVKFYFNSAFDYVLSRVNEEQMLVEADLIEMPIHIDFFIAPESQGTIDHRAADDMANFLAGIENSGKKEYFKSYYAIKSKMNATIIHAKWFRNPIPYLRPDPVHLGFFKFCKGTYDVFYSYFSANFRDPKHKIRDLLDWLNISYNSNSVEFPLVYGRTFIVRFKQTEINAILLYVNSFYPEYCHHHEVDVDMINLIAAHEEQIGEETLVTDYSSFEALFD